jgi:hypothetical protein
VQNVIGSLTPIRRPKSLQLLDANGQRSECKVVLGEEGQMLTQIGSGQSLIHDARDCIQAAVSGKVILMVVGFGHRTLFIEALRTTNDRSFLVPKGCGPDMH